MLMKEYPECPLCNSDEIDMEFIGELYWENTEHKWKCTCNNCGHRFGFSLWYDIVDSEYWPLDG